jgi:hypothetical protein
MKLYIFLGNWVTQFLVTFSCKECGVYVLKVPNYGIKKRALARSDIAYDAYELALFDAEVNIAQREGPVNSRVVI